VPIGFVATALCAALLAAGIVWTSGSWPVLSARLRPTPMRQIVTTTRDLPAYTLIKASDIITASLLQAPANALTQTTAASLTITVAPIARGSALTADNVRHVPFSPNGYGLITVAFSATLQPRIGERVTLLGLTATEISPTLVSAQALALGAHSDKVVLALPWNEALQAAAYLSLGRSLIVVRRL
jgi:hypothetical protein